MRKYTIYIALAFAMFVTYAVAQQAGGSQAGNAAGEAQAQSGANGQNGQAAQAEPGQDQNRARKDSDENKAQKEDRDKDKVKSAKADDQPLERQVREQLSSNQKFQAIQVSVKDAVVELDGSVPNKGDRREAAELAKSVPGVRKVRERLTIAAAAAKPSGEEAREAGAKAPEQGENTAGSISGNTSAAAGTSAGAAQQGTTAGVTGQSGASGQPVGDRAQVQSQVQQAIQNQPALASKNITVNVMNRQLILSGAVASDQEKQQAEQIAQQYANGLQVVNNINVSSSASAGTGATGGVSGAAAETQSQQPGSAGAAGSVGAPAGQAQGTTSSGAVGNTSESGGMAPDQLKAQLQQAFQSEPTLSSCNLVSNVTADTVEVSGTCPTGKEKQTARRMAQSLAGNRRVVDRITVSGKGQGENQEKPEKNDQNPTPPPQF